jgi:serine/threonine protein kinase/tetratricopeptide (TPR) repeat protein
MPAAERYQQYELLRREDGSLWELGRGAMGITYKAYDTNLHFTVALKVINSVYLESDTARQRFLREARAAAALRHPNVASVFNLGADQDNYFYVMEFIDGETVEAYVMRKGPVEPAEVLNIALQVARALAVAAKQHLVHRDLKPTNLMLVDQEGGPTVKVIDFGLAKAAKDAGEDSAELTMGGFVGTPHFASPEQVKEGEVDIRSDIYSLGATLYFMLVGQSPFSGSVGQIMSQHLHKPLPMEPLTGLPACVVSLLQRMMEKDRNDRPQTPQDLQKAILACLEEIRGSSGRRVHETGEPSSASATLDLSCAARPPLGVGAVLAQNYQLIEELVESPQGRKFLADDIRHMRRVSLLVLSREFSSDTTSLARLHEVVHLLRNAPHPTLREIYSLETVTDCSFLVEEYVVGPSLLDVLRTRGVLTAPEVVRLLSLLAPLADHASRHRLQQVNFSLSGIYLANQASTGSGIQPDLLQRPLTAWEPLKPKVDAIDFSFLSSDTGTWAGSATQIPGAATDSGPPGGCVRLLSLLTYELLGGPRNKLESTGQYTPIAALTQEGNGALRRGLADECSSAGEFVRQLADEVGVKRTAAPVSQSTERVTQEPLPGALPPKAEIPIKRKSKMSAWSWVLALGVMASLGIIGGYAIYRSLHPSTAPLVVFGNLAVESDPTGAAITLDERPPLKAPYTFDNVKFGSHRLTADLKGYLPIQQDLQFDVTTPPKIVLKLKQSPPHEIAALSIQTEPPGASILLDGTPPQAPPNTFTHVPFGAHQLTATLNKYEPIKQNIEVRQGMNPEIYLKLKQSPPDQIAWILNLDEGQLEEARKEFAEALLIYRELAQKNQETYRPEVARTLNNLAILDSRQGRMEEARKEFAEALLTYRDLAQKNQETYRPLVATTINNLGNVDLDQGRMEEAGKEFSEALQIRRELAQKNPEIYRPLVARTLNNLAILDRRQNRIEEARKEFSEALQIYRDLAQKKAETYRPFVATMLNNLGSIDLDQGRIEEARKEYSEALQIRRELAQKNPEIYRPYAATTLSNLAMIDSHQGRMEEARKEFAEALEIYEIHAKQDPGQFNPKVARVKKLLEQLSGAGKNPGKILQEAP